MSNRGRGYNPRSRVAPPVVETESHQTIIEEDEIELSKAAIELDEVPVMPAKEKKSIKDVKVKKEEPQKPTYNFSRNQNGQAQVESAVVKEQKQKVGNKEVIMKEMLLNIDKEILKTEVEIEIHQVLEKEAKGPIDTAIANNRIENYYKNLDYLNNKKRILQDLIKPTK